MSPALPEATLARPPWSPGAEGAALHLSRVRHNLQRPPRDGLLSPAPLGRDRGARGDRARSWVSWASDRGGVGGRRTYASGLVDALGAAGPSRARVSGRAPTGPGPGASRRAARQAAGRQRVEGAGHAGPATLVAGRRGPCAACPAPAPTPARAAARGRDRPPPGRWHAGTRGDAATPGARGRGEQDGLPRAAARDVPGTPRAARASVPGAGPAHPDTARRKGGGGHGGELVHAACEFVPYTTDAASHGSGEPRPALDEARTAVMARTAAALDTTQAT